VQSYTGFIYGGPTWPRRIHRGLVAKLRDAHLSSIEQAIGADAGDTPVSPPSDLVGAR
jgi:dihydroorotate dehydrogenase